MKSQSPEPTSKVGLETTESTDKQTSAVCEEIWSHIARMETPGFFVTAEIQQAGSSFPSTILMYIQERIQAFEHGITTRKFVFSSEGWRIHLTFFPTNQVVDERYALKNKVMKTKKR